jgi:hypothetical protein
MLDFLKAVHCVEQIILCSFCSTLCRTEYYLLLFLFYIVWKRILFGTIFVLHCVELNIMWYFYCSTLCGTVYFLYEFFLFYVVYNWLFCRSIRPFVHKDLVVKDFLKYICLFIVICRYVTRYSVRPGSAFYRRTFSGWLFLALGRFLSSRFSTEDSGLCSLMFCDARELKFIWTYGD